MGSVGLSVEERVILSALSANPPADDRLLPLVQSADPRRLLVLANQNRVVSSVRDLLLRCPDDIRLPDRGWETWNRLHEESVWSDLASRAQILEAGNALVASGIRAVLYKGPDFQMRFHPHGHLRPCNDIDLIVRRGEATIADRVFLKAGYRPSHPELPLAYYLRFHLHATYRRERGDLPIELHWALDSPYRHKPQRLSLLLEAALPAPEFGPGILRPAVADALALMALHFRKHLLFSSLLEDADLRIHAVIEQGGLPWLMDVAGLLRKHGEDWEEQWILDRMRAWDAVGALREVFRLVDDLGGGTLPGWGGRLIHGDAPRMSIASRILFPESARGRMRLPVGRAMRRALFATIPGLDFRPVRALETILSAGSAGEGSRDLYPREVLRVLGLASANISALLYWKCRACFRRSR